MNRYHLGNADGVTMILRAADVADLMIRAQRCGLGKPTWWVLLDA